MRKRTCLERLNKSFSHRITQLEVVANDIVGKSGHDIDRAVAFVSIEALTSWSGFAREFYLACAFLQPRTINGHLVSHQDASIVSERLALIHSISVLKGRQVRAPRIAPREEPVWHEKRALLRLANSLSLSNSQSVVSGLSFQTTFFDELPTMRNFYAHRSHGTAEKVISMAARRYGTTTIQHPNELTNTLFSGRVQTLIQEWLGDMKRIGLTICQ